VNYLLDWHQITSKFLFPRLSDAQSSTFYHFMPCIIIHGSTLVNPCTRLWSMNLGSFIH